MNMALDGASCVSETVSLKELVSKNCLPALVRLEEGIRGDIESLSLSSGDVIALVACSGADNGQGTVLAHYTSERKIYKGGASDTSEKDVYRALILLPLINPQLASLEVSICQDSYGSFINTKFNGCDWVGREEEVLREKAKSRSPGKNSGKRSQVRESLPTKSTQLWAFPSMKTHCPMQKLISDAASLTARSAGGRADRWVEVVVDTSMEKPVAPPRVNRGSKPVNALNQTDSVTSLTETTSRQPQSPTTRNTVTSPAAPARIPLTSPVAAGAPPTSSATTGKLSFAALAKDAVTSSGPCERQSGAGHQTFSEMSSAAVPRVPRVPRVARSHVTVDARVDHSGNPPHTPLASRSLVGTNQTLPLRQSPPEQSEDAATNCGNHDNTNAIYEIEDDVPVDTCLGFTLAAVYGDDEEFCSSEQGNGSVIRLPCRETKKSGFQMRKLTKVLTEQAARLKKLKKLPAKVSRTLRTSSSKDDKLKPTSFIERKTDDVAANDNDEDDNNDEIYVEIDEAKMSDEAERVKRLHQRDTLPPAYNQEDRKGRAVSVGQVFSQWLPKTLRSSLPAQTHSMMEPPRGPSVSKTGKR